MKTLTLISLFLFSSIGFGQIFVEGRVISNESNEGLPFVKIMFDESPEVIFTDEEGYFFVTSELLSDTLRAFFLGFETHVHYFTEGNHPEYIIRLSEKEKDLNTVVVKAGENPAFKILRKIRENEPKNNPERLTAYECGVYTKMRFDLNNMSGKFEDRKLLRKFDFIMEYMDSTDGERYLPVLFSESFSELYFKSNPNQYKEIAQATRVTGVDNFQLSQFTGDMSQHVNIYDDYLDLFNKAFLSPLAGEGKLFYKYYLQPNDTLDDGIYHHIIFIPKRKGGALFDGEFWVSSTSYAVKKIIARIPNDVNLNYVSDFGVTQEYDYFEDSLLLLSMEEVTGNFDVFNEWKDSPIMGATIHRKTQRKDYVVNEPKDYTFYVQDYVLTDSAKQKDEGYWEEHRTLELSEKESGVIEMVDSLKENRTFKFYDNLAYLAYSGFWRWGPIELGNAYGLYNRNVVEGTRFLFSPRTSNKFSKKVELSGFVGYGTLDREWKYGGSVRLKLSENPREMLRFAYRKRIDQLGLIGSIGSVGNSFSTLLSAAPLDKLTMVNLASVGLEKDWKADLRTFNNIEWKNYVPLGSSDYSRVDPESGDTSQIGSLTSFQIRNQVMYTREEKFIRGQFDRLSLGSKYPIISLTHTWGIKDFLQSEYDFHRLDFIWNHRPRLGMLGRLIYTVHFGKIFGQVPYPFLEIHQGNETYYLQDDNFNMMNYYEFISDQWIRVLVEHHFQGFIMDRVPLIRKLKLRLVASGKMVMGSYDEKHNKELLLPFYSQELTKPYYEAGVGIENILKFIRVDAIWRLSYRENVDLIGNPVSNFGVKFVFTSDF